MKYYKDEFIDFLKLKSDVVDTASSGTEIVIKCPSCESKSKKNHGHLYIGINEPLFNCFKCPFSGPVKKLITALNGDDIQLLNLEEYRKFFNSYNTSVKPISPIVKIEEIKISIDPEIDFTDKYNYLKSRLGENYEIQKIPGLVIDVKTFIKENNIQFKNEKFLNYLNEKFVGFVSTYKTTMIMRNIEDNQKIRYYKMNLKNINYNFPDFYNITDNRNEKSEFNTIVLSEGVFDILKSYKSSEVYETIKNPFAWVAILGKDYYNKIKYILNYHKIPKTKIVILSDRDVSNNFYKRIKRHPMVNDVKIFWNDKEKDFCSTNYNITEIL